MVDRITSYLSKTKETLREYIVPIVGYGVGLALTIDSGIKFIRGELVDVKELGFIPVCFGFGEAARRMIKKNNNLESYNELIEKYGKNVVDEAIKSKIGYKGAKERMKVFENIKDEPSIFENIKYVHNVEKIINIVGDNVGALNIIDEFSVDFKSRTEAVEYLLSHKNIIVEKELNRWIKSISEKTGYKYDVVVKAIEKCAERPAYRYVDEAIESCGEKGISQSMKKIVAARHLIDDQEALYNAFTYVITDKVRKDDNLKRKKLSRKDIQTIIRNSVYSKDIGQNENIDYGRKMEMDVAAGLLSSPNEIPVFVENGFNDLIRG